MKLKTRLNYFSIFILVHCTLCSKAQQAFEISKINPYYSIITLNVAENKTISIIEKEIKYTSLMVEFNEPCDNEISIGYFKKNGTYASISTKVSNQSEIEFGGMYSSPLQIFEIPQTIVNINFGAFSGFVKIKMFNAPPADNSKINKLFKSNNPCDKPQMISYTVWREFLPNPKPPREKTEVQHLVIHHSAGNNNDTNYINTVRNIYLLHTQSNGWDDIGYNYLVAPNGVIFNGRDPQGAGDDDEILGAHFCGKNQNTMGICMLGNFMVVKPTDQAIFSLRYLLAWKLKKNGLNAFGQTHHPQTAGNLLNNICGHKDGCATDCPGNLLYALLASIKTEAARIADSCGLVLQNKSISQQKNAILFPNPSNGNITISLGNSILSSKISVYAVAGNLVETKNFESEKPFAIKLKDGIYFYEIEAGRGYFYKGILKIKN